MTIFGLGFALLISSLFFVPQYALAWDGKVINVSDGDTITVLRGTEPVRVRLYGIDTPEKKQPFGNAAKKFTLKTVAGKTVDVEEMDIDKYGRIVGWVTLGPVGLNEELVRNGYAWVYRKYCRHSACSVLYRLENQARQDRLGLWQEKGPVPPWEWRKKRKLI